jgi:nucleoside permease NupC
MAIVLSLNGLLFLIFMAWLVSENRKRVSLKTRSVGFFCNYFWLFY